MTPEEYVKKRDLAYVEILDVCGGGLRYREGASVSGPVLATDEPEYCLAVGGCDSGGEVIEWLEPWGEAWCDDITSFASPATRALLESVPGHSPHGELWETVDKIQRALRPLFEERGVHELINNAPDSISSAILHRITGLSEDGMGARVWEIMAAGGFPCGYAPPEGATLDEYSEEINQGNHFSAEERKRLPLVVFWPHDGPLQIRSD